MDQIADVELARSCAAAPAPGVGADDITLTLLDDRLLVREAMAAGLVQAPGLRMASCFSDVHALLEADPAELGQVILSSYVLDGDRLDGIAMIRLLRAQRPQQPVLIVTAAAGPGLVAMALRAGADGVVSEARPQHELLAAIRAVADGQTHIARDVALPWPASPCRAGDIHAPLMVLEHPWLTDHEREVLRCCLAGLPVIRIAAKLGRSAHTISTQKRTGFRKLNIHSDFDLFALFRSAPEPGA